MDEKKYFIWCGKYVGNSLLFWREGRSGYTTDITKAHLFSLEEANRICQDISSHQFIDAIHCQDVATLQVHADHVDQDLFGKEVTYE
jgi:hypothetical protein